MYFNVCILPFKPVQISAQLPTFGTQQVDNKVILHLNGLKLMCCLWPCVFSPVPAGMICCVLRQNDEQNLHV